MDYTEHVAAVRAETDAFVGALWTGPVDAAVPSCPGWTLADLAKHAGEFAGFWAHVVCEGTGRPKTPLPEFPSSGSVAEWCGAVFADLITVLEATPANTAVWTWVPDDQSARFVARRAAHELSVHRFDAQLAVGRPEAIAPQLAADGIEEIFVMIGASGERSQPGTGQTLHLHGTDRGDEWLLTLAPGGMTIDHTHAKADLAMRGAVSDLELVLYQRPPIGVVDRFGDEAVLAAWYRAFTFG